MPRWSKADVKALQMLEEIRALREKDDRTILEWVIRRVVPRADPSIIAVREGSIPIPWQKRAPRAKPGGRGRR